MIRAFSGSVGTLSPSTSSTSSGASALCVAGTEKRVGPHGTETHYVVRHLERLPRAPANPPALADRAAEVSSRVTERVAGRHHVYVNATGLGQSVVDLFSSRVRNARVMPVYFSHGDRRSEADGEIRLGKANLVTRLQTLLQSGCLHLPRMPDFQILAQELQDYEIRVEESANDRNGAFRVGARDELITALGLATQPEPGFYG